MPSAAVSSLMRAFSGSRRGNADGVTLVWLAVAQVTQGACEIEIVGDDHGAFAAAQRRRLREIEDRAIAEIANARALVARAYGFGAVLDQVQPVLFRQHAQRSPVRRMAVGIARQNDLGFCA